MEGTHKDPISKITRPDEPELDLYTIPSRSCWFSWDDIHETERAALNEFFNGSSITRTPKIYKEYRDFIINKYREDPSRQLRFSEIRKSLVGDVSLLHKVFLFLEKWGLINFSALQTVENEDMQKVMIEEGAPIGIRVTATATSLRPLSAPPGVLEGREERAENGFKLPPLTSYSDVFGDSMKPNALVCSNCGERYDSGHYDCTKGNFTICEECFKNGNYGESKTADDFKLRDNLGNSSPAGAAWTEEETLLLLESVLKHGDDWELVARNIPTKSKLDCISKLIELPFGEFIKGSASKMNCSSGCSENINGIQVHLASSDAGEEQMITEGQEQGKQIDEQEENGDDVNEEPPLKRKRTASISDVGSSLMKQVALMASTVGPPVTAAAAEAAIAALCDETSCPRDVYDFNHDDDDDFVINGLPSPRAHEDEDAEMKERLVDADTRGASTTDDLPLAVQIRASAATALGAAAAHAKLLADQEEREMENIVATIIQAQLEKLQSKVRHFDELELMMEKEHREMEGVKERILEERISILEMAFRAGITKRWDHAYLKPQN